MLSCFDVILPKPIPYKGQILNQIAEKFLKMTKNIVPNWVESVPDPNVTIGKKCNPFDIEMVIRGYLSGNAWREYKLGKRELCGVELPNGMKENDKFPSPIITPTSKAQVGHDMDLSKDDIIQSGLINKSDYNKLEEFNLEIGAGLGDLAGKAWRIGLMGYGARSENISYLLDALKKLIN